MATRTRFVRVLCFVPGAAAPPEHPPCLPCVTTMISMVRAPSILDPPQPTQRTQRTSPTPRLLQDKVARAYTADLEAMRDEPVSVEFGPDRQTAVSVSSVSGFTGKQLVLTGRSKASDLEGTLGQRVEDELHLHFSDDSPRPPATDAALAAEGRQDQRKPGMSLLLS